MLSDTFHNPHILKDSKKLTQLVYGMVFQPSNDINTGVTSEVSNLFTFGNEHLQGIGQLKFKTLKSENIDCFYFYTG